jgi:hypothetical protein
MELKPFGPFIQIGLPIVFGVLPCLPIADLPPGSKAKIRFRKNEFARAFVRTKHGTSAFYLCKDPSRAAYRLGPKIAENHRTRFVRATGSKKLSSGLQIIRHRPLRKLFL